jgi:hypothetical protein
MRERQQAGTRATMRSEMVLSLCFGRFRPSIAWSGASGIGAGDEPEATVGGCAVRGWRHDVSILILIGVGRYLGELPRAKTSMISIRLPQHGQGRGQAPNSPASVLSGSGSVVGSGTSSNSRALATFSARLPFASSP